jgi:hypothetical protein
VLTLVKQGTFSEEEWEEIKAVIDSMERDPGDTTGAREES